MGRVFTRASTSVVAAFALVGCGVFGGGADYRLSDQLERIPDPREGSGAEAEAAGGQDDDGEQGPARVIIRATNYERLAELMGEEAPLPEGPGSDDFEDQLEAYSEWSRSAYSHGEGQYHGEHPQVVPWTQGRVFVWRDELGVHPYAIDQYVEFLIPNGPQFSLHEFPEEPAVDGMLEDHDLLPDEYDAGVDGQTFAFGREFEDHKLLAPEGATVADDADIMAAAEAIDAEGWYFSGIVTGIPDSGSDSDLELLEPYSYLGMAFDEVDGDHITRIIFVHEEEEAAEVNAERFEQNLADDSYDYIEFQEADTDGRVLSVEVQNNTHRGSLWQLAFGYFDPIFAYRGD